MDGLLQTAVVGNLRYLAAVLKREDPVMTDRIQRQAGIDTTRAEFARGSLPVLGGVSAVGERATQAHALLRALRRLSGEATLLRFDISAGLCEGDAQAGERWSATAAALEAGGPLADVALKIQNGEIMAEIAALERAGRGDRAAS